jgi:hypothetical protein
MAFPFWMPFPFTENTALGLRVLDHALPLGLAIVMVVAIAWPPRRPAPAGVADLAPRGLATFTRPRWLGGLAALVVTIVAVSAVAGVASRPDDEGRHLAYRIDAGLASAGTWIYGWYFSVPSLIAMLVLVTLTLGGILLISRPSLGPHPELATRERRARTRTVLAAASGGLLLHLGDVFGSLGGTASLAGQFSAGTLGTVSIGTSFAALGPALHALAFLAGSLGFALWWFVLLSAIPVPTRDARPAS